MPLKPWRRISGSILFKNPWWTYRKDDCELPSGKGGEYHFVHTEGSSMIIPVTANGEFLMVKQYRYLGGRESIEFPCGSVKEGATHDATAWHELAEETGYSGGQLFLIGEFNPYNGVTDEMCRVYVARELQFVGGRPDESEEFELIPAPAATIDGWIRDGTIWDGMTIAAWHLAKTKGIAG